MPTLFCFRQRNILRDISPEDQKRLTQQITDAIHTDVIPAYKTFAAFLQYGIRA